MTEKKNFMEALNITADHLSTFLDFYNREKDAADETVRILSSMGSTVSSYSDSASSVLEFIGQKEDWDFVVEYMKTFMKLKKLADAGGIQYGGHKDEYGFPTFEVSVMTMRGLEERFLAFEKIRKAALCEKLEAKLHEAVKNVLFEGGGGNGVG